MRSRSIPTRTSLGAIPVAYGEDNWTAAGRPLLRSQRSADRLATLLELVATGALRVHVRDHYRLDETAAAHRDVETGHGRGKIALLINEP